MCEDINRIRDIKSVMNILKEAENLAPIEMNTVNLGEGKANIKLKPKDGIFYNILSEICDLDVKSEHKENNTYISEISININGKIEEKTLFVLELSYAAYAEINVAPEHKEAVLMIELPRLIFPFARNIYHIQL